MSRIKILPEAVINKIAAGEVIERPASVVKELLENALDAGASSVRVAVRGEGLKSIRVEDNGEGMEKNDILLAFERHSTSKLESFSDLKKITSLGFRGEALPSIAAVSEMELTSRPEGSLGAWRLQVAGGLIKDFVEVGAPAGTTVETKRLFFNTPARRKFLKSPPTEMAHIVEVVTARAFAYPHVAFSLDRESGNILSLPAAGGYRERVEDIWGGEIARRLVPLEEESEGISLWGLVGLPELSGTTRKGVFLFVNKRPVRDRMIFSALVEGYGPRLPARRFPMGVLFLEINPEEVDVNIHPAKREVRFGQPARVRKLVVKAVEEGLRKAAVVESFFPPVIKPAAAGVREEVSDFDGEQAEIALAPSREDVAGTVPLPATGFEILGQLRNTYLLLQTPEGLLLLDQHAAHERIIYEQFRSDLERDELEVQQLLTPLNLELGPTESALLREQVPVLNSLGIDVEDFGSQTFIVTALPALLAGRGREDLILDAIADIGNWEKSPADPREAVIIRLACLAAVKARKKLPPPELQELVERLFRCQNPSVCPHGRPTMLKLSWEELERRFGRR